MEITNHRNGENMNKTLMMDYYELTMAQTYYKEGKKDEIFYFDIFFRKNPFNGGYTISGGLEEIIDYIENFKFKEEEIAYLKSLGTFDSDFLDYLKNLNFNGDLYAVEDGTIVFPNEPVITVKADAITAQLLETGLLACFNHGSLVTTKAKRITKEAKNIPVMEFGARRARGISSAIEASKYSYIGGCSGTSNTYAGMKYKIPVLGTMAHSLITESENEYVAFLEYAKANPKNTTFLVDTYDTLRSGIKNAIKVANDYLKPNGYPWMGIRIDSGDLAYLSKEAKKMLIEAGYPDTKICLSNGLDEYTIRDLLSQGAIIDSLGVGDNISASLDRVGGVYKLVAIEENNQIIPKMKVSNENTKTTNPGYKKVYRFYDRETGIAKGDVISLAQEEIPTDEYTLTHPTDTWKQTTLNNYVIRPLLQKIYEKGQLVYQIPNIEESKAYCEREFKTMYPEVTRIMNPHEYYVDLSDELRNLKQKMIHNIQKKIKEESEKNEGKNY